MRITDFSIRNPVKVAVGVILVCLFGLLAFGLIPVQLTPEVVRPSAWVWTQWPGASPQEIETEIVSKQEEQLQDIQGMIDFRSECSAGSGEIEMEFAVGTDLNSTLLEVVNKLQQVRDYPQDADEPIVRTVGNRSSSIAYLSLVPRAPEREQLRAFLKHHPELAEPMAPLFQGPEVDVPTIHRLAAEYPAIEELLVDVPDVLDLRTFAEDVVAARIQRVDGVGDCDVYGGSELELRVVVNPAKLAAHNISLGDLRDALGRENRNVSAGDLWEGKRRYIVRTLGQFDSPGDVADTIVAYRDEKPVYVRDLADVDLTSSKTQGVGHQRGVDMLTVAVKREQGSNVLLVMEGVRNAIDELNNSVLKARGLYLMQSYDETVYIDSATELVTNNLLLGGLLAAGVLLLFLRDVRSTLVVALAIPICAIGTFLVIKLANRSINVISLAGMAFAIGMVLDAAIVVLENIFRHHQSGEAPPAAASRGASEVWGAVLASTLTTAAVFRPVIFIQEEAGQLFRDIAIAITAGVSLSLIVSLTVIPTAAARLLRSDRSGAQHATNGQPRRHRAWLRSLDRIAQRFANGVTNTVARLIAGDISPRFRLLCGLLFVVGVLGLVPVEYRTIESWPYWYPVASARWLVLAAACGLAFFPLALARPRAGFVLMVVALALGLSYKIMPDAEYLPEGNKNLVFASLQTPPGYNIEKLIALGNQVESRLKPYWEARPGTPEAEALDGPLIDNFFLVARGGSVFMGGRAVDASRAHELVTLFEDATSGLPGVNTFVNQSSLFERRMSESRSVKVEITGPDIDHLVDLGRRVMSKAEALFPRETETQIRPVPSLDLAASELHIRLNREKAAQRGVTTTDLGYAINALNDGAYAGTYWHQGKEIDLVIFGDEDFNLRTQDIERLPLNTPTGEMVSVADVADVVMAAGPEEIIRIDRQRAVTIQVRPGPDISLESTMNRIQQEIIDPLRAEGADVGGLYQFHLAGTADDLRQMRTVLSWRLALSIFITFLLIAALYESFLYPVVIMVSVPLAAVGGFAGLRLLNLFTTQRLDILTMLGFIILVGTVVNNAILIVERALQFIRRDGLDHRAALVKSVETRIRPIFMTTATTVLGMAPLVLFPGAGSELYRGLGSVVLGGLIVSTMFTLFLVPTLFALLYELRVSLAGAEAELMEPDEELPISGPPRPEFEPV